MIQLWMAFLAMQPADRDTDQADKTSLGEGGREAGSIMKART